MSEYRARFVTLAAGVIVAAAVVGVGVLKTSGALDGDTANTAISLLIGLVAGGGIATVGARR